MGRARGQKREFCVLLAIEREAPGAILLVAVRTADDSYSIRRNESRHKSTVKGRKTSVASRRHIIPGRGLSG
jgi:hypothetical protein